MKIKSIMCKILDIPLKSFFQTSYGRFSSRQVLLVKVHTSDDQGIAECPVLGPFYSPETTQTAQHIIQDHISNAIIGRKINNIEDYVKIVSFIRGHRFAKSGVELALWDLLAKQEGLPLYQLLGGVRCKIPSQISIGVKDNLDHLLQAIKQSLEEGYRQIKIKIQPGWDKKILENVRKEYPDISLMVDANAAYSLDNIQFFKELDRYNLSMIEQPLHYNDLYNHAKLQEQIETPICLDESIHSLDDAITAIKLGSCKIINIKVFRVGGLYETKKIQRFCVKNNIDVWCGGMIETGLGKAFNLAAASLPGFTLPNDITPSKTYFTDEIIEPPIKMSKDGYITLSDRNGIGYAINNEFIHKYQIK